MGRTSEGNGRKKRQPDIERFTGRKLYNQGLINNIFFSFEFSMLRKGLR